MAGGEFEAYPPDAGHSSEQIHPGDAGMQIGVGTRVRGRSSGDSSTCGGYPMMLWGTVRSGRGERRLPGGWRDRDVITI